MSAARTRRVGALAPIVMAAAGVAGLQPVLFASAPPEALAAWSEYVNRSANEDRRDEADMEGRALDVPGGTIHHWRGSTTVSNTSVDKVVHALMYPGTPPPQEDVLESRVLARHGNRLRVYLKLARTAIVTVVYDTEHEVTFFRTSPGQAASRSVSLRIDEVGGADRGFLWKLNSNWRYSQVGSAVRVDLESLSLSRDIPWFVRAVANPLAHRIARESLERTLASVRRFLETRAT